MAAIDIIPGNFPRPSVFTRIASAFATALPKPATEDDDGARRSFILEMLEECPEAFAHEEGVRGAMYYFSGRF